MCQPGKFLGCYNKQTFLEMGAAAIEAPSSRVAGSVRTRLQTHAAKATSPDGRILIDQVRPLRPAALPKVADLHHFGEQGDVHSALRSLGVIVFLENLVVLMECALVPILLQELLLAFRLGFTSFFGMLEIFFEALFFRKSTPTLDLLALSLASGFCFFVPLNPA